MRKDRPSNQQIAAYEAQNIRAVLILLVSVALLIASIGLLMLGARTNLIPGWLFNGAGTVLFLGWVVCMLILTKRAAPPPNFDPLDEDYLRQTIDIRQRRNRYLLLLLLIDLLFMAWLLTSALAKGRQGPMPSLFASCYALVVFLILMNLSFGPGIFAYHQSALNDELSRAQRAKAAQFGYIFAVMEMCAILTVAIYRPIWSVVPLPLAIASAIALPSFYFLYLEWRSDRG